METVKVAPEDRNRFSITDAEVEELARQAMIIEKHYGRPMDIEWAKDGDDGRIYIVQARPETVKSRAAANVMERPRPVVAESAGPRTKLNLARRLKTTS